MNFDYQRLANIYLHTRSNTRNFWLRGITRHAAARAPAVEHLVTASWLYGGSQPGTRTDRRHP
jgi:hypothetical protein